jgi:hypothetical protein
MAGVCRCRRAGNQHRWNQWLNYEKLDKASNRYVLFGDPLPEPIEAHTITYSLKDDVIFPKWGKLLGQIRL